MRRPGGATVPGFRGEAGKATVDCTFGRGRDAAAHAPAVPRDREGPRKGTGRKLVPFLAFVLGLIAVGLAWSSPASAGTGTCVQTGMETVATDGTDYPPGATVHVTGTGYAAGCDVQLNISRPDSVVDSGTATTDPFGNFSYDYVLPPPPGVIGEYGLDVLGYGDVTLASMTFTDAAKTWTGATSTEWNLAGNWSPSGIPGS